MKTKTATQVLKDAKKIVTKGWCKNHYAVNKAGKGVYKYGRTVAKCCSEGAIFRAAGLNAGTELTQAIEMLESVIPKARLGFANIPAWNDHKSRTKAQVLKAFTKAIKAAEKAEKTAASTQVV